jgi:hypothetical protein
MSAWAGVCVLVAWRVQINMREEAEDWNLLTSTWPQDGRDTILQTTTKQGTFDGPDLPS